MTWFETRLLVLMATLMVAFSELIGGPIALADTSSKPSSVYATIDDKDAFNFAKRDYRKCLTYDRISLSVSLLVPLDKLNRFLDRKDKTKIPTNPEQLAIWDIVNRNERYLPAWPYRTDFPCPSLQNGHELTGDALCRFYRENPQATAIHFNGMTYCKEGPDAGSAGLLPRYVCQVYGEKKLGLNPKDVSAFVRYIIASHQVTCFYIKVEEIELLFQRRLDWIEDVVWEGKEPGTYPARPTKLYRRTESVGGSVSDLAKVAQNPETGYELLMRGFPDDLKENIIELARVDHKRAAKYYSWLSNVPSIGNPVLSSNIRLSDHEKLLFQHEDRITIIGRALKEIDADILTHRKTLEAGRTKYIREKNSVSKDVLRAEHLLNAAAHEKLVQVRNDIESMRLAAIAGKEKYEDKHSKERRARAKQRLKSLFGDD